MKLIIKQSSWSGWSKDYKPNEVENEYEIKLNEKYVIKTTNITYKKGEELVDEEKEILSFNILEANDNSIRIKTNQVFSDNDDNSINLRTDKDEFIITTDKPLKLTTPTMDYGDIFIFTLIK